MSRRPLYYSDSDDESNYFVKFCLCLTCILHPQTTSAFPTQTPMTQVQYTVVVSALVLTIAAADEGTNAQETPSATQGGGATAFVGGCSSPGLTLSASRAS